MSSRMQAHFLLIHPCYVFNYCPRQDHMSIQASHWQGATRLPQLLYTKVILTQSLGTLSWKVCNQQSLPQVWPLLKPSGPQRTYYITKWWHCMSCKPESKLKRKDDHDDWLWHLSVPMELSPSQQVLSWVYWLADRHTSHWNRVIVHYHQLGFGKDERGSK